MAISDNGNDYDDNNSNYNSDGNSDGNSACNCVNGCKVTALNGTCDVESVACDFNCRHALPNVARHSRSIRGHSRTIRLERNKIIRFRLIRSENFERWN